jgi:hypothetical protein
LERKFEGLGRGEGGHVHLERAVDVVKSKLKEMEGRVTDTSIHLNQYTFYMFMRSSLGAKKIM